MSARSKLRRLQLENARLAEIAQAAGNVKNELYDILFHGEDPAEREVRWKWILLEAKKLKHQQSARRRHMETKAPIYMATAENVVDIIRAARMHHVGAKIIVICSRAALRDAACLNVNWYSSIVEANARHVAMLNGCEVYAAENDVNSHIIVLALS